MTEIDLQHLTDPGDSAATMLEASGCSTGGIEVPIVLEDPAEEAAIVFGGLIALAWVGAWVVAMKHRPAPVASIPQADVSSQPAMTATPPAAGGVPRRTAADDIPPLRTLEEGPPRRLKRWASRSRERAKAQRKRDVRKGSAASD